jgi:tetratricopeptide (TPR) repeat protein
VKHYRDDFEGAEAAYRRALELNPNDAETYLYYGYLLRDVGRPEEALALHRRAVELNPLSANAIDNIGLDLSSLGRFDEALVQFEKAFEIDPDYSGASYVANHYWLVAGQLDQAVVWYAKDISLDPASPIFSATLGELFLELGDPHGGEYWIKRSIELGPERFVPNHAMQLLAVYQGDEAAAWDYGRKAAELLQFPGKWEGPVLTHLRDHELRAGRYPEARALYETGHPELLDREAPKVHNWNYQAAIDLALVLFRTGEHAQADLLLNRSFQYIQTHQRFGEAGYGIADVQIYAMQGNKQKALSALRQAIDEGWRHLWWYYLKHDPNLESLHDEPEYQAMVAEIEADMATQLERVREMVRNGELAAISRDEANLQ